MNAQVLHLPTKAAVDAAWSKFQAHAERLFEDNSLWESTDFRDQWHDLHDRYMLLFSGFIQRADNVVPLRRFM